MSTLAFRESPIEMLSTERLPLAFDMTAVLGQSESVTAATVTLTDIASGTDYATGLIGNPLIASPVVTQTVGLLQSGHRYRMVVTVSVSAGKSPARYLEIGCPT